jgi:hypothetical protein
MTIDAGPTVTGYMLDNREDPAFQQPLTHGSAEVCNATGVASVSAVADHRIGSADSEIEDRQAIDRDAEASQVVGHQPRSKASGPLR